MKPPAYLGALAALDPRNPNFRARGMGPLGLIDIGSSKVAVLLVGAGPENEYILKGYGYQAAQGIKNGNIIDAEAASRAIRNAIHSAEAMAGVTMERALVNLSTGNPTSYVATIDLTLDGNTVDDNDVARVLLEARRQLPNPNDILIHMLPVSFAIDGNSAIADPRGLSGEKFSTTTHLVTAQSGPVRTLLGLLNHAQIDVPALILSIYASGLAVLTQDEMELGATVIDMGAGLTSFGLFTGGRFVFADRIPIGGQLVTSDLARGLGTPLNHAERLKALYGQALASHADERELITVPLMGESGLGSDNQVPKAMLARIIRPRLEETFERVLDKLAGAPFAPAATERFVLTGGASQLPGVRELAQHILGRPVRLGTPRLLEGMHEFANGPAFATALGLLKFIELPPVLQSGYVDPEPVGVISRAFDWLKRHV
ncbi:MAG: cell division protein FtsA [Bdellovibrionales bacterium]